MPLADVGAEDDGGTDEELEFFNPDRKMEESDSDGYN